MTDLVALAPCLALKGLRNLNSFPGAPATALAAPPATLKVCLMIFGIRSPIALNSFFIPLPTDEKASLSGLVKLDNASLPAPIAFMNLGFSD